MIDLEQGEALTEWDEAFLTQWLKLWFGATEALMAAGWRPERGLHTDLWTPPEGVAVTTWAALCLRYDAEDARAIRECSDDPFVHDAADAMIALWSIADAIAHAGSNKAQARQAALWGLNAATYMIRRHPQSVFAHIAAAAHAELGRAKVALEAHAKVARRQSEAAIETAAKRVEKWHPRAKEIARAELARWPKKSNEALATAIALEGGKNDFSPPGLRQIARAVASWRGAPDGIPAKPGK